MIDWGECGGALFLSFFLSVEDLILWGATLTTLGGRRFRSGRFAMLGGGCCEVEHNR